MQEGAATGSLVAASLAAGMLVIVHLLSGRLTFLAVTPRSIWLSMAGGVSVAYVFIHLLPELAAAQETLSGAMRWLEHPGYLLALIGLVGFYGLEALALRSRGRSRSQGDGDWMPPGAFYLHLGAFALYNVLVGYLLLHRERAGLQSLSWFAVAMALHFLVADVGLREHYKHLYDRIGRYVLSAAVAIGLLTGALTRLAEPLLAALFAVLAGGVVLNVLKEELPEERQSRFWAFAAGAAGYTLLLLLG